MKTNTITHQSSSPLPGQFLDLWQVLIHPTAETFRAVGANHAGKFASSLILAVASGAISCLINYFYLKVRPDIIVYYTVLLVITFPILLLFWAFFLHQFYKKLFGRSKDHYEEMAYNLFLAVTLGNLFQAPIVLIPEPYGQLIGWLPVLYMLALICIAVTCVTHLRWWQSLITVILSAVVSGVISVVFVMFAFQIMRSLPGAVPF